jgi:chromosome partitioning protein
MRRLLRAFGIGKQVQEEPPERHASGPAAPSPDASPPKSAHQDTSIGGGTLTAAPVGGQADIDGAGVSPSSPEVRAGANRSDLWFDDSVEPDTVEEASITATGATGEAASADPTDGAPEQGDATDTGTAATAQEKPGPPGQDVDQPSPPDATALESGRSAAGQLPASNVGSIGDPLPTSNMGDAGDPPPASNMGSAGEPEAAIQESDALEGPDPLLGTVNNEGSGTTPSSRGEQEAIEQRSDSSSADGASTASQSADIDASESGSESSMSDGAVQSATHGALEVESAAATPMKLGKDFESELRQAQEPAHPTGTAEDAEAVGLGMPERSATSDALVEPTPSPRPGQAGHAADDLAAASSTASSGASDPAPASIGNSDPAAPSFGELDEGPRTLLGDGADQDDHGADADGGDRGLYGPAVDTGAMADPAPPAAKARTPGTGQVEFGPVPDWFASAAEAEDIPADQQGEQKQSKIRSATHEPPSGSPEIDPSEDAPPGLEPGLEEIVQRLASPAVTGGGSAPMELRGGAAPTDRDEALRSSAETQGGKRESQSGEAEPQGGGPRPEQGRLEPEGGTAEPEDKTGGPGRGSIQPQSGGPGPEGGRPEPKGGTADLENGTGEPERGSAEPEGSGARSRGGRARPHGRPVRSRDESVELGSGTARSGTGSKGPRNGSAAVSDEAPEEPGSGTAEPQHGGEPQHGSAQLRDGASKQGNGTVEPGSGLEGASNGLEEPPNGSEEPGSGTAVGSEHGSEGTNHALRQPGDGGREGIPASDATSVAGPQKENISPARAASRRGRGRMGQKSSPKGQLRTNVSRETLSLGEVADNVGEDEVMQDEAAIAVREAALRAAAEVPGANAPAGSETGDVQSDVSRETSDTQATALSGTASPTASTNHADSSSEESMPTVDIERAARDARVTFRINRGPYNRFAIAVANQKGGVGKSTTAVNLGAYLALAGARVLVVDLDPQGNASTGLGLDHRQIEPSVYDVLMGDSDAASAIHKTAVRNLDVLPSTIDLAGAEVELVNAFSRETRLRQALGAVRYNYDLVFIDCPPSLGLLTVNALAAADELLIPIQCEYYALEGLGQLLRNVDLVRVNLNQALHIGGIVLTMYDGRTRLAEQVVQEVRKHFTDLVYQTVVPRSVRLSESPGYGVPIALYDPLSRGGIAYRDLALELADRTGLLAPTREGAN